MNEKPTAEAPGYGRDSTGMTVHRTTQGGEAWCGGDVSTIGDRDSALDAVRNHGAKLCTGCSYLVGQ